MNILIVNSDSADRYNLKAALERFNHSVTEVSSVDMAREALTGAAFDLVITNSDLGVGGTGLEVIRTAKGLIPGISVIMVTDSQEAQVAISAFQCGADGFLLKPFTINKLIDTIDNLASKPGSS